MSEQEYDVVVLGCGSAGSRAAATAQGLGAKVLAVDSAEELGGLCILRGCMPTKTLLQTAHRLHEIADAERFGIKAKPGEIDFPAAMERMRQLVARFQRAKVGSIEGGGYELRRTSARFVEPHLLEVGEERVRAKAVVVATGSRVRPLNVDVPAGAPVVTSDEMFLLESAPRRALVLGAGAVGLEFAQWMARIGTDVTLANRSPIFSRRDPEAGQLLATALGEEMRLVIPGTLRAIELEPPTAGPQTARVTLVDMEGDETVLEGLDLILNATGRPPNLLGLDLEAIGVNPGDVRVGETLEGPYPHIFVAGDASARSGILHIANLEGALAGRNACRVAGLLDGEQERYRDLDVVDCEVVFTDPTAATCGLTPKDCRQQGIEFVSAVKRFPEQGRGIVMGARHGQLRLVVGATDGKVLGCQLLGERADDLIHIPIAVMSFGGTVEQMYRLPWYHPTLSEAFVEVCRQIARELGRI